MPCCFLTQIYRARTLPPGPEANTSNGLVLFESLMYILAHYNFTAADIFPTNNTVLKSIVCMLIFLNETCALDSVRERVPVRCRIPL